MKLQAVLLLALLLALLAAALVSAAPICTDPYEPNESFAQAWYLLPGIIQSYVCTPNDLDYYKFTVQAGDVIHLELDNLPADYNLCLYDPAENLIKCSQNGGTSAEVIEEIASSNGDYYAQIYGVQGVYDPATPYTFTLQLIASSCPDPYEPNETFATAWSVSAGAYYAYICTSGDQDWFHIVLLPGQEFRVTLTDLPKNYDLELYDPLGRLVASSHNGGTTPERITFTASAMGGDYRVRVFGVAGDFDPDNPYALKLQLGTAPPMPTPTPTPTETPVPTCGTDPYEPNESFATAASIAPGTEIHAYLCPATDSDYYRFPVSGGVEIFARLYDLPAAYRLTLFDPSGSPLVVCSGTGTEPRELTYLPTTDGDYALAVSRSSPTSWDGDHPYSLQVNLDAPLPMTLYAVADTYVTQGDPTSTHGSERVVIAGRNELLHEYRGLFRFDLSSVPATTIASAYFEAYLEYSGGPGTPTVDLRRVSGSWDEYTVNWNTKPWSVSTGIGAPVGGITDNYFQWDVTDLVQDWLTGGVANRGLELRSLAEVSFTRSFRSREYGYRAPRLIINFEAPDPGALGSISGTVYDDANENGGQDSGESVISNVRIHLFRDSVSQGDQTTASDGTYTFDDLPAGSYEAVVEERTIPTAYELISADSRYVLLAAGEDRGGVDFRVAERPPRPPPPDPTLNLSAEDIEFIQVIQGGPLIRGKHTLVRVYVGVTGVTDPVTDVNGILWRDAHPDDVIEAMNRDTVELLVDDDPLSNPDIVGNLDHTLNFRLPDDWTTSGLFRVQVNASPEWVVSVPECPGCNVDNQTWRSGTFHDPDPLNVVMVAVEVDGISPSVSREEVYRWLLKTYPINDVNPFRDTMTSRLDFTGIPEPGRCNSGWSALVARLRGRWFLNGGFWRLHYYGMIDDAVPHGHNGCGHRDRGNGRGPERRHAAAGIVGRSSDEDGRIMAHEIGHNLTRPHTCCSGEGTCVNQHPGGIIGVYGVDMEDPWEPDYITPTTHHDIMTYCPDRWPSDITYSSLLGWFTSSSASRREVTPADGAQQEYLVGSGFIVDGLVIMPQPFYRFMLLSGTSDEQGEGPYTLELQDASGIPLFTRYFDNDGDSIDPDEGAGYFQEIVPWQAGTARIVIKEGQTVLLITHVSAHTPEVTLLSPNGGEFWPPYGEHIITWTGTDADGDPLRYVLQYSADGGNTWKTVATDLVGESYSLDAGSLAGSETALLRVVASDGVNTSQDGSDGTFIVEGKPPEVYILYPLDGSTFRPGRPVALEGAGTDLEDGPLTNVADFTWSSSLEGELGIGRKLHADDLLPGLHTITLEVADSEGFVGEDSVSIAVGSNRVIYLPIILKISP